MKPRIGDTVGCNVSGSWTIIAFDKVTGYRLQRDAARGGQYFHTVPPSYRFRWVTRAEPADGH